MTPTNRFRCTALSYPIAMTCLRTLLLALLILPLCSVRPVRAAEAERSRPSPSARAATFESRPEVPAAASCEQDPACLESRALALLVQSEDAQGVLAQLRELLATNCAVATGCAAAKAHAPRPTDEDASGLAQALRQTRVALRALLETRQLDATEAGQLSRLFDQLESEQLLYALRFDQVAAVLTQFQAGRASSRLAAKRQRFDAQWASLSLQLKALRDEVLAPTRAQQTATALPYAAHRQLLALDQALAAWAPESSAPASAQPVYGSGPQLLPQQRPGLIAPPLPESPGITPSYAAGEHPPVPLAVDLAPSGDTDLTESVRAKAASLGHDPVQMFDFVRTQIHTEFYPGARKSADQVMASGRGNDLDQATLLIALLRASRAPARYVQGILELPAEELAQLLGVPESRIGRALNASGLPHEPVLAGGRISSWRILHTWVSAWVPYGNYRGNPIDASAPVWLPLAPALKRYAQTPASSLLTRAGLSGAGWVAAWLGTDPVPADDALLPLTALRTQLNQFLAAQPPPLATYQAQLATRALDTAPLQVLPAGLPFPTVRVLAEAAELRESDRQRVTLRLLDGTATDAPLGLTLTRPLKDLLDRRISLSYAPATVDDAILLNLRGAFGNLPAWLIRLRAQILIDGQPVATGLTTLEPGQVQRLELSLWTPAGELSLAQQLSVGTLHQLDLSELRDDQFVEPLAGPLPNDAETDAAAQLSSLVRRYTRTVAADLAELADLTGVRRFAPWPQVNLVLSQVEPLRLQGLVERIRFQGVALDAALHSVEAIGLEETDAAATLAEADYYHLSGLQASALEADVFQRQWDVAATSADRLLRQARRQNIDLLTLTPGQNAAAAGTTHSPAVLAQIQRWLDLGHHVQTPRTPLTADSWTGSAWRVWKPGTGEAGYFLSGVYAGGLTIPPPQLWSLQALIATLGDPFAQPPNLDPLSGAFLVIDETTDRQTGRAGEMLPAPVAVYLFDASGRPVQGGSVRFSVHSGTATLPDGELQFTNSRGKAETTVRLGERLGEFGRYVLPDAGSETEFHGVSAIRVVADSRVGELGTLKDLEAWNRPNVGVQLTASWANPNRFDPSGLLEDPPYLVTGDLFHTIFHVSVEDRYGNLVPNTAMDISSSIERIDGCHADQPLFSGPGQCPAEFRFQGACGTPNYNFKSKASANTVLMAPHSGTKARGVVTVAAAGIGSKQFPWVGVGPESGCFTSSQSVFVRWRLLPVGQQTPMYNEYFIGIDVLGERFVFGNNGLERPQTVEAAAPGEWLRQPLRFSHYVRANQTWYPVTDVRLAEQSISHISGNLGCDLVGYFLSGSRCVVNIAGEIGVPQAVSGNIYLPVRVPQQPGRALGFAVARARRGDDTAATLLLVSDGNAVELVQNNEPDSIRGTPSGNLSQDVRVQALIKTPDYIGLSGLQQVMADDSVVVESAVPQPRNRVETILPRGLQIPVGEVSVQTTLNPGTPWEIKGTEEPLQVRFGLLTSVGKMGEDNSGQPRPPLDGVFEKSLSLQTSIDLARQQVCHRNARLTYRLSRPADMVLTLQPLNEARPPEPAGVPVELDRGRRPAGLNELVLDPAVVEPGLYRLYIEAVDPEDPSIRERPEVSISHHYHEYDSRSFGHSELHDVNVFDGSLNLRRTDLLVPGRGPILSVSRAYASNQSSVVGYQGRGWSSPMQQRVEINPCDEAIVYAGDAGAQAFARDRIENGVTIYRPLKGSHGDLRFESVSDRWVFHRPDGTRHVYAETRYTPRFRGHRLTEIADPSGNVLSLTYAPVNKDVLLTRVQSLDGRSLDYEYEDFAVRTRHAEVGINLVEHLHLLKRVRSQAGDQVEYSYDDYGNLITAAVTRGGLEGPGESYAHVDLGSEAYSEHGRNKVALYGWRLHRATDHRNGAVRTFEWSRQLGLIVNAGQSRRVPQARVSRLTEADLGEWSFAYLGTRGTPDVRTELTDPRSQLQRFTMNAYGAVTVLADAAGEKRTEWNMQHMKLASETDRLGRRTEWTYDTHGNPLTERVSGMGPTLTRAWTYRAPESFDPPFIKDRIARETDARNHETTYEYDTRGRRTRSQRGGVQARWAYFANGDLESATNGADEQVRYSYTAHGLVSQEMAPLGATRTHTYDAQGRRDSTRDERDVETRWAYDPWDRVIRTTDPIGVRSVLYGTSTRRETDERGFSTTYTFDPLDRMVERTTSLPTREEWRFDGVGNLIQEVDPLGRITTHTYDGANRRVRTVAPGGLEITLVPDAEGHVLSETRSGAGGVRTTVQEYQHPSYQPTRIVRGGIASERRSYDANGNLTQHIDPRGYTTIQEFDSRDRLVARHEPEGRSTIYAWDAADRQVLEQHSSGWKRATVYNALGQAVQRTDGEARSVLRTYDLKGNVLTQTDRRGGVIAWTYDERGRLRSETGPVPALQTSWTYDGVGNVLTETRANGQVLTHVYDEINRRTQTRDADGVLEALEYDKAGNILKQSNANGEETRFVYNELNQRTRQTAPLNRISQIVPSVHGEVLTETQPTGGLTAHEYDALGRRTKTTFPQTPSDVSAPFATWSYDPSGNLTHARDARGLETVSEYDGLNRRTQQTDPAPLSHVQRWTYDTAGNVLTHTDRNQVVTTYTYDTENRKETTTRAGSLREQLEYDGEGGLTARIDALDRRTSFVLDKLGRVIETRLPENLIRSQTWTPLGDLESINDGTNRITRFTYDLRRRKIGETNGANETTRFAYDPVGNLRLQAHPLFTGALPNLGSGCALPSAPSHTVRFCYDEANRLIAVIDGERNRTTYEYDRNDNLTAVIEPLGGRSEFLYDLRNRRIEKKSPDLATGPPQIWRWTYDANGNPLTQTDPVGTVSTHSYDVLNRRSASAYTNAPPGSPSGRTWSYDPNGNSTRITETRDGQTVALELTYDAFNRPTNLLDANGRAWTQTFDAADQRRTLTSSGVPAVHWNYDNAARNTQIIVEGAGTFDLGYDAADRNESISHPNGVQTTHQFDPAGRIADIHHARNGGTIARFQYQYDANGNRIHQIEENGGPAQTSTFAYDHSDRLTEIAEPSRYTRYTLDGNSNRIRTDAGATAGSAAKRYESSFNARNELTQQREYNGGGTVITTTDFEFDANGNIRRQSSATAQTEYRYDALDRLIEITPPTGPPASYRYGPSDVRIASISGGQETRFHYDGERLILETNPLGNPQKHYAYTAAGLLNTALLGGQPQHPSAHLDAQTSPIAISAANGNLLSRSHFDPFGVETPLLGNRDHRITHQGYWSEPELEPGAQLSAARLYLPGLGIYPERDPVEGLANSPITFNPYLIGRSNPLRWVDPDGRCDMACQYAHLWAYNGPDAANQHLEVSYPKSAIALGVAAAVGDTTTAIVKAPFHLAAAIGGSALEQTGLMSGHKYSDQLGGIVAGSVETAKGIYEHGPVDYASLKAGEVARRVQDAIAEGRNFDAGREGGNAVIGGVLSATGTGAAVRSLTTRSIPDVPASRTEPRLSEVDGEAGMPLPGDYQETGPTVQRLTPEDFGANPIVADPRLHRMWEDAMKEAYYGDTNRPNKGMAYRDYLDALGRSVGEAESFARRAFNSVRGLFKKRVDAAIGAGEKFEGFSFENIHHWNWYLRDHVEHAVDPRQLLPVTNQKHRIIHEATTKGPDPTYDPIDPAHLMELDGSYPLAPRE